MEFSNDMELAAMICVAETERKRSQVPSYASDFTFVSKLYYPLWAIPRESNCFLLDGMKITAGTILLLESPDPEVLVDNLKRNTKDQDQYFSTLRSESETFAGFLSRRQVSFAGYIADKEMLSDIVDFLKDMKAVPDSSASQSSSFIQPKIDNENAVRTADEILGHYDRLQSEIKGLRYGMEMVNQETKVHVSKLQQELQEIQEDFNQRMVDLSKRIEEKTTELGNERDSEIERITMKKNRKIDEVLAEKRGLERELLRLEQDKNEYEKRKALRKSKKDKPGEARWEVRLKHAKKQISRTKGKQKSLSNLIMKTEKGTDKATKKLSDDYRKLVDREKMKIVDLEKSRDLRMKEKNEEVAELQRNTLALTRNIEALIEQINVVVSRIEEGTIPWETETPTLIGIPLYIICHKVGNENRYLLFSPAIAQEYRGLMMRISATLGVSSLESRINSLLKPRSKNIERLFSSLRKELGKDRELEATVNQIGMSNNLTNLVDFKEKLREGLDELEDEGWIEPEEKEAVLAVGRRS